MSAPGRRRPSPAMLLAWFAGRPGVPRRGVTLGGVDADRLPGAIPCVRTGWQQIGRYMCDAVTHASKRSQIAPSTPDQAAISRPPRVRHGGLRRDPHPRRGGRARRRRFACTGPRASSPSPSRTRRARASSGRRGGPRGRLRAGAAPGRRPGGRLSRGHPRARAGDARRAARPRTARPLRGGWRRIVAALRALGVDARVGEVPGEYCPGAWSVNARGAGEARGDRPAADLRRRARRAACRGRRLGAAARRSSCPVYEALELDWDPATAGAVEDEVGGSSTSNESRRRSLARAGARSSSSPRPSSTRRPWRARPSARAPRTWHDPAAT